MVITPDWLWGDVGSNPAQGKLSFKHLLLKYDYLGCALSGCLSYTLSLSLSIIFFSFPVALSYVMVK